MTSRRAKRPSSEQGDQSAPWAWGDPEVVVPTNPRRRSTSLLRRVLTFLAVLGGILAALGATAGYLIYEHFSRDLPGFEDLADYRPPVISRISDRHDAPVAEFHRQRRSVAPLPEIPEVLLQAVVAAEDDQFFHHEGLDYFGILRAFVKNLRKMKVVQGGSTITQQVLKNFLLQDQGRWERKSRELLLAHRLESNLTKYDLLYLYLNHIYFGHGCYGVAEAARFYFDKSLADLDIAEAALIAGVLNGPELYSPLRNPAGARKRQRYVLDSLVRVGWIDAEAAAAAKKAPLKIVRGRRHFYEVAPYYAEHVRRELAKQYGDDALYEQGLGVRAAVDAKMQAAARDALRSGLRRLERKVGWREPELRFGDGTRKTVLAKLHEVLKAREQSRRKLRAAAQAAALTGELYEIRRPLVWDLSRIEAQTARSKPLAALEKSRYVPLKSGGRFGGIVTEVADKTGTVSLGGVQVRLAIKDMAWARPAVGRRRRKPKKVSAVLKVGDVVIVKVTAPEGELPEAGPHDAPPVVAGELDPEPRLQGAIVAIDPETRHVLAMVGGYDFTRSPLNRVVQSRRQPGSSFKPIVYAAAINSRRYTGASIVRDAPFAYVDPWSKKTWAPQNFDGRYRGPMTLRQALTGSINTVSVRTAKDLGPKAVIAMARRLGIRSELYEGLPIALGASGVTPLELANAYAVLASGGMLADPVFIEEVRDRDGRLLEAEISQPKRVIHPAVAHVVADLMRSVVEDGTGKAVKKLGRPIAGKTGTTNEHRDAWFVGFTPQLVVAVWVGYDNPEPMGRWATGGSAAAPIWRDFVGAALGDAPPLPFVEPRDLELVRVRVPRLPEPMKADAFETWEAEGAEVPIPDDGEVPPPQWRFEPLLAGTVPPPTLLEEAPPEDIPEVDPELDARLDALLDKFRRKGNRASPTPAP